MKKEKKCKDNKMSKLLTYYYLGILSSQEKDAFEAHLIECSSCRKELDLTEKLFSFINNNREEIIAHLKRKEIGFKPARSKVINFLIDRKLTVGISLLIFCFFIICIYYFLFLKKPIPLNENIYQEIRGENIKIYQPAGKIKNIPQFIRWNEIKGAEYYLIQLKDENDKIIWSALSHENEIKIPSFIQEKIKREEN
ncbi:zf-HC2 domain-containing protein, partial [Candidatus Aminicenantes bacterium AH-873-B07]|nr:zf-HC2 domain-containing protein [Candidatus Aminicenantes bacterium AH-873-B07]